MLGWLAELLEALLGEGFEEALDRALRRVRKPLFAVLFVLGEAIFIPVAAGFTGLGTVLRVLCGVGAVAWPFVLISMRSEFRA